MPLAREGQVALVFGNETCGLTGEEAGKCRLLATIPADSRYSSLNLAAAVQVFCYELRQAATGDRGPRTKQAVPASHQEIERFLARLERTAIETGFLNPQHPKRLMPRLRRLFSRTRLEAVRAALTGAESAKEIGAAVGPPQEQPGKE